MVSRRHRSLRLMSIYFFRKTLATRTVISALMIVMLNLLMYLTSKQRKKMRNLRWNILACSRRHHPLLSPQMLGLHMPPPHLPLPTHQTGFMHPVQGRREGRLSHLHVEGNSHLLSQVMMLKSLMTLTFHPHSSEAVIWHAAHRQPYFVLLNCANATKHHFARVGGGYLLHLTQLGLLADGTGYMGQILRYKFSVLISQIWE